MPELNDVGLKTFEADEAIPKNARVKLDPDGKITVAGLTDREIGTAQREAFAAGDKITVRMRTYPGTHWMIAVEQIEVGDLLYTEAAGKVQDTAASTAFVVGTALSAAAGDGDLVEVLYNAHGDTAAT